MHFFALSPISRACAEFAFKLSRTVQPVGAEGPSATSGQGEHRLAQLQACETKGG